MTKLPSSDKVIAVLVKNGFHFKSQKGSHKKYTDGIHAVIVPAARKEIPLGNFLWKYQVQLLSSKSLRGAPAATHTAAN